MPERVKEFKNKVGTDESNIGWHTGTQFFNTGEAEECYRQGF
jgi:hypothetical protein